MQRVDLFIQFFLSAVQMPLTVRFFQAGIFSWRGRALGFVLLLCLGFFFAKPASAQLQIHSFQDLSQQLTVEQVNHLPAAQWQVPPANLAFGIQPQSAIWLELQLPQTLPQHPYLVVFRANLQSVCLLSQRQTDLPWQKTCINAHAPAPHRDFNSAEPVFELAPELAGQRIYLRIQSQNYIHTSLQLLSKSSLASKVLFKQMLDFGAIGTLLSLTLLNLVLAIWLRDKVYAWQALAVLAWGVYWFGGLMGYSAFWGGFWQNLFDKMPHFIGALACLSSFFAIQYFIRQDLNRYGNGFLHLLKILLAFTLLVVLLRNPPLSLLLARIWGILVLSGIVLGLGWMMKARRYVSAFYLSCWFAFYSSLLCVILTQFQILPFHYYTYSFFSWLQCLSMLSLTLVIAVKLRLLRQDHQRLLLSNLRLAESHQQDLEKQVAERTEALQRSLHKLEESDQSKSRLFAILAHDLRSPFHSLITMLQLVEDRADRISFLQSVLPGCKRQVIALSASLDNMLTWAQAEIKGYPTHQEAVSVKELFDETMALYAPSAEQKQIIFCQELETEATIWVDPHHARLILRNLVNNAVKFTPPDGKITLGCLTQQEKEQQERCVLFIEDTGVGIALDELDAILSQQHPTVRRGTSGERGVGMGMQLCQAYLKANQARMQIMSQEGIGTRVVLFFQTPSAVGAFSRSEKT
jgi:two-component system, sensor histidine kinase LadS